MRWPLLFAAFAVPVQAADWKAVVEKPAQAITKDRKYAAVVVGVLDQDKEEFFSFGEWDGRAPDRDSVYEIGSITKVFTGTLLADRVKAGVVKLDDPVQKHLPDGWTVPRRDDRDITLLQLATHSSGLPKGPKGFLATAILHPDEPFKYLTEGELKKALPETPIIYPIGARCEYSNLGVGLLGHALVHASKAESYETLVTDRVLKPLGMGDTTITLNESQTKRLIPGHNGAGKRIPSWDFPCLAGCGAIRSTVGDMLKFLKANADPTGPLAEAIRMAQQNWRDVRPKVEEAGLCWIRYLTGKKDPPVTLWHNGQTGGYHSFVGFVPGRGGVVVLCNVATFDVDKVGAAVIDKLAGDP